MENGSLQEAIVTNRRILALSDVGTVGTDYEDGEKWLLHAEAAIREVLKGIREIVVFDYAMPEIGQYCTQLQVAFGRLGIKTVPLHERPGEEKKIAEGAQAHYFQGGHNARFAANLHGLRQADGSLVDKRRDACPESLVELIRNNIAKGVPYIGVSAGAIAAGPDFKTGNDKCDTQQTQIIDTQSGLTLIKAGINPHYPGKNKTERDARLQKFADKNNRSVIGIPDESFLDIRGPRAILRAGYAVIFQPGRENERLSPGDDLSGII